MARLPGLGAAREALGLDAGVLRSRAGFYLAYARNLERGRSNPEPAIWARLANPAEPWLGPAMIASSYRAAAQYAALFDTRLAIELMMRASRAYLDAGAAFGLFLAAGVLSDQALLRAGGAQDVLDLSRPSAQHQAALPADPVQQAYLLLTVAARPVLRRSSAADPGAWLNQLAAYGIQPIGAQGVPLETYLDIADVMLSYPETRDPDAELPEPLAASIASRLAAIGRTHADAIRLNQRNGFLWQEVAAPVNIIDLEQTALFGLAAGPGPRRSGQVLGKVAELLDEDEIAQLPSLAVEQAVQVMPGMTESATEIFRHRDADRGPAPYRAAPPPRNRQNREPGSPDIQPYGYGDDIQPYGDGDGEDKS